MARSPVSKARWRLAWWWVALCGAVMPPATTVGTSAIPGAGAGVERGGTSPTEIGMEVGQRFPDLELPDLDGRPRRLSEFRGRKLILHVFASW